MTDKLVIEALERLYDAVDEMMVAVTDHTDVAPTDLARVREHMHEAENAILALQDRETIPIFAPKYRELE